MQYRKLRAPASHGQRLIDPPLTSLPRLVAENRILAKSARDVGGTSLASMESMARHDLVMAARKFTGAYRDIPAKSYDANAPLVLAGHQPTLFHPGVWYKNFVLDDIAKQLDATAINLRIDNDVASRAAIRVPTGSADAPRVVEIPFDRPQPGLPFEECRLLDPESFETFGTRVRETVHPFSTDPLIDQLWPLARESARRTDRIHQSLAEARHRIEAAWGLETLELPLSVLCQQPAFRTFMSHVLAHAVRFRRDHNETLDIYRTVNRVRSKTHPVPKLVRQEEWLETPFWIWTTDNPRRRPLFIRDTGRGSELADLQGVSLINVPLSDTGGPEASVPYFEQQERLGIKIRPRAIMTTLFCRLFLSDLFIHGIGGAKYDQLTDELIQKFFGRSAPSFLVVTATAQLPIEREPVSSNDLRRLRALARELRFNPQRHLKKTLATQGLIEDKQNWIRDQSHDRRTRHEAITRLNKSLSNFLGEMSTQIAERTKRVEAALSRERILASREFSFCLFSESTLQALLLDI